MVRTEHRLEAYATLTFRTSSDLPGPSRGAIAVHRDDATAQSSIGFQPVFRSRRCAVLPGASMMAGMSGRLPTHKLR